MKQLLTNIAQAIFGLGYGFCLTAKIILPRLLLLGALLGGGIALIFGLTALLIWIN